MARKIDVTMPQDITLQSTYSIRVTAIDQTTGNVVSGVKIGTTVLTVDAGGVVGGDQIDSGLFILVPGPAA